MEKLQYVCPKCGCTQYESDQFQATGGNFAKLFDVQNKKFVTVSCVNCGYTELYKAQSSDGWNILDFLDGEVDATRKRAQRPSFLYVENHSLGEWFQRRLVPMMKTEKLLLL